MTKFFFLCFSLCFSKLHIAQTSPNKVQKQNLISATFPGGRDSLDIYIYEKVSVKRLPRQHGKAIASIEINSLGEITKVDLTVSTKHPHLDSLFIDALKKMPKWIPAKNDQGNNCSDKQIIQKNFFPQIGVKPAKN